MYRSDADQALLYPWITHDQTFRGPGDSGMAWLFAVLLGSAMGGIIAVARALYACMIPEGKEAQVRFE